MHNMKITALALAAGMALSLSACTGSTASSAADAVNSAAPASSAASSVASSAAATAAPSASTPASEGLPGAGSEVTGVGRPATTTLQRNAEGEIEDIPCTLFVGEGYSIYLPDDAWKQIQTADRAEGTPDVFVPAINDQVMMSIMPNRDGATLQEAYDALLSENYTQSDDNDHYFVDAGADGMLSTWYVVEYSGTVWYISWSYPDTSEYGEGWGSMLPVIAESFAVNE